MNGSTLRSGAIPSIPDIDWQVQGLGDFNDGRKADVWMSVSTARSPSG